MAEKLGIEPASYNRVETGKIVLTLPRLYKIAKILDVSVFDILGDKQKGQDYSQCPNCKIKDTVIKVLAEKVQGKSETNQNSDPDQLIKKIEKKGTLKF